GAHRPGPPPSDGGGPHAGGGADLRRAHRAHRSRRAPPGRQGGRALAAPRRGGRMSPRPAKRAFKRALASTWGWRLVGPLLRPAGVIVLMYHRIVDRDRSLEGLPLETFAAQMRWLRSHCEPIAPEAIVERARGGARARPAVLVTFDDGYRDYHDL